MAKVIEFIFKHDYGSLGEKVVENLNNTQAQPKQLKTARFSNHEILKAVIEILYELTETGKSVSIMPLNFVATFSQTFRYGDTVNITSLLKAYKYYTGEDRPSFMKQAVSEQPASQPASQRWVGFCGLETRSST